LGAMNCKPTQRSGESGTGKVGARMPMVGVDGSLHQWGSTDMGEEVSQL